MSDIYKSALEITPSIKIEEELSREEPKLIKIEDITPIPKPQYTEYSERAELHQYFTWYEVKHLIAALKSIRQLNADNAEDKLRALTIINDVPDNCPYSRNERFPEGKIYVSECNSGWMRHLDEIRVLLAGTISEKNYGDNVRSYHDAISTLMGELSNCNNVYDRKTFELAYDLIWG